MRHTRSADRYHDHDALLQEEISLLVPVPGGRSQTALRAFCRESMRAHPDLRHAFSAVSTAANLQISHGESMHDVVEVAMEKITALRNDAVT